jgi:signal peptidase II
VGRSRALLFAAVLFVSAGCDHVTKQVARDLLAESSAVSLAADTVRFELAYNPGGFLSLGSSLPAEVRNLLFLTLVPLGLLLACLLALRSASARGRSLIGLGLLAGGGLANWLDRVANGGAVTDFVSLGVGPLRTGIFNVADVLVIAGGFVLLFGARPGPRLPCRPASRGAS